MKKLTASEARDLTELAGMSEIYEEISRRAQVGLNTAEFIGEIKKDEFEQLIKDGYKTVLVDRREIGNGSTSATTSMLQYEIDIPLFELSEMIGKEGAEKSYWACYDSIDNLQKIARIAHKYLCRIRVIP